MSDSRESKRRWYQYSLRSLLVVMTLVAIACSWHANEMQKLAREEAALELLEAHGASLFVVRELGSERRTVTSVGFVDDWRGGGEELSALRHFPKLHCIIFESSDIAPSDLGVLEELPTLVQLSFGKTRANDEVLTFIRPMKQLEKLSLTGPVTDDGIDTLRDFENLEELSLCDTEVSIEKADELFRAIPTLKTLHWEPALSHSQRSFTEALDRPEGMPELRSTTLGDLVEFLIEICRIWTPEADFRFDETASHMSETEVESDRKYEFFDTGLQSLLDPLGLAAVMDQSGIVIMSKQKAEQLETLPRRVDWSRGPKGIVVTRGIPVAVKTPPE